MWRPGACTSFGDSMKPTYAAEFTAKHINARTVSAHSPTMTSSTTAEPRRVVARAVFSTDDTPHRAPRVCAPSARRHRLVKDSAHRVVATLAATSWNLLNSTSARPSRSAGIAAALLRSGRRQCHRGCGAAACQANSRGDRLDQLGSGEHHEHEHEQRRGETHRHRSPARRKQPWRPIARACRVRHHWEAIVNGDYSSASSGLAVGG
ncbi:hypothetical protein BH11GEM1_BH11GEM1_19630 [soil metagenome]